MRDNEEAKKKKPVRWSKKPSRRDWGQQASLGHLQPCLPGDARLSSLLRSSAPWAGAPSAGLATEDAHPSSAGRGGSCEAHSTPGSEHDACAGHRGCSEGNRSTASQPCFPSTSHQESGFTRPLRSLPSNPSAKITCSHSGTAGLWIALLLTHTSAEMHPLPTRMQQQCCPHRLQQGVSQPPEPEEQAPAGNSREGGLGKPRG